MTHESISIHENSCFHAVCEILRLSIAAESDNFVCDDVHMHIRSIKQKQTMRLANELRPYWNSIKTAIHRDEEYSSRHKGHSGRAFLCSFEKALTWCSYVTMYVCHHIRLGPLAVHHTVNGGVSQLDCSIAATSTRMWRHRRKSPGYNTSKSRKLLASRCFCLNQCYMQYAWPA